MPLTQYKAKRNIKKSSEPKSKLKKSKSKKLIFIIQKHRARNLHYDFRLEMNKVLKSWALPKQPPRIKGLKRLAIQVEDHPINYAKFKGTIPKGNYGAGKVEIWDNGTYELIEKDSKKIEFTLHGKKLKGDYVLIKTNYQGNKSWLFFKV
ncbi:3'-phosphoesterase [Candidatus Pacearchaeota archaeon]|nr:3'-phosphoesterase [Candidatus Pacearchaeota archaeon]